MTISDEHRINVCQLGTENCCAYILLSVNGFECAKNSRLKLAIDLRLAEGTMNAIGDNCGGWFISSDSDLACEDHCQYDAGHNCRMCDRFENTRYMKEKGGKENA